MQGYDIISSCLSLGLGKTDKMGTFKVLLWSFLCNPIDMYAATSYHKCEDEQLRGRYDAKLWGLEIIM
jgi:hypothetical protein